MVFLGSVDMITKLRFSTVYTPIIYNATFGMMTTEPREQRDVSLCTKIEL